MKKYTVVVTQTDVYRTFIEVIAENSDEAENLVKKDLDACPIEERNALIESDVEIETYQDGAVFKALRMMDELKEMDDLSLMRLSTKVRLQIAREGESAEGLFNMDSDEQITAVDIDKL